MTDASISPWVLIANPTAGGGRALGTARKVVDALSRAGVQVRAEFTRHPGDAAECARQALDAGAQRIVVCGGDGTINELLHVLSEAESAPALGIVPCGTCNDLALALGIPLGIRAAVQVLLDGTAAKLDLARAGDRLFATVAGCGFDAQVSEVARDVRWLSGTAGYIYAALKLLRRFTPPRVRISGDFGILEEEVLLVATGNTRSYGGGMRIVPDADPHDGRLDICIVRAVPNWTVLHMLGRVFAGRHVNHPAVRIERSSWVAIERISSATPLILHGDGENLTTTPFRIEVMPAAISVIGLPAHINPLR